MISVDQERSPTMGQPFRLIELSAWFTNRYTTYLISNFNFFFGSEIQIQIFQLSALFEVPNPYVRFHFQICIANFKLCSLLTTTHFFPHLTFLMLKWNVGNVFSFLPTGYTIWNGKSKRLFWILSYPLK